MTHNSGRDGQYVVMVLRSDWMIGSSAFAKERKEARPGVLAKPAKSCPEVMHQLTPLESGGNDVKMAIISRTPILRFYVL
jgi:hypothetical protein